MFALLVIAAVVMAIGCPPAVPLAVVIVISARHLKRPANASRARQEQARSEALARHRQEQFRAIKSMS